MTPAPGTNTGHDMAYLLRCIVVIHGPPALCGVCSQEGCNEGLGTLLAELGLRTGTSALAGSMSCKSRKKLF